MILMKPRKRWQNVLPPSSSENNQQYAKRNGACVPKNRANAGGVAFGVAVAVGLADKKAV